MDIKQPLDMKEYDINAKIDNAINNAKLIWSSRLPLNPIVKDEITLRFQTMLETLDSLSSLPLNISKETRQRKIEYYNNVSSIPTKYIQKVRHLRDSDRNGEELYLIDMALGVAAINDIAIACREAMQIKKGETTIEKIHQEAVKGKIDWDSILNKWGNVPDKSRSGIARGIFHMLEIVCPIENERGPSVYEKVVVGHMTGWNTCDRRKFLVLNYVKGVRDGFEQRNGRYRGVSWHNLVCLPRIMQILANNKVSVYKPINTIVLDEESRQQAYIA